MLADTYHMLVSAAWRTCLLADRIVAGAYSYPGRPRIWRHRRRSAAKLIEERLPEAIKSLRRDREEIYS